jgi:hypothetical protein
MRVNWPFVGVIVFGLAFWVIVIWGAGAVLFQ